MNRQSQRQQWVVSEAESYLKLLEFIKLKVGAAFSNKKIKQALDLQQCYLNGRLESFAATRLRQGDRIELAMGSFLSPAFEPERILYEDEALLIYDKPPFIASVTENGSGLAHQLLAYCTTLLPVHRLDRDTSGVIIFAKQQASYDALLSIFKEHLIQKTYLALVHGTPKHGQGVVEKMVAPLKKTGSKNLWGIVASGGLVSKTAWSVKTQSGKYSLLTCHPITGRTHQIRVHLSYLGHPIVGDTQYGSTQTRQTARMLLHACSVTFPHPITKKKLTIESPLPADFQAALANLLGF